MQTQLFPIRDHDEKDLIRVCEQAMRLLLLSGEQAPVEMFLRGLKHSNKNIRIASISALLRLNARLHLSSIRSLLQDEEKRVQETAAWVLACWEESVPRELLVSRPYGGLQKWIIEVFPSNWSHLFPLRSALECVFHYHGFREYWGSGLSELENAALFQRLAGGISPQPLIAFLHRESDAYYAAWKILKVQDNPLPLEILSDLLSYEPVGWEAGLLIGKHRMVSASDLLGEMWALTDGKTHTAIAIALDDLGKINAIPILFSELQGRVCEAKAAIWGLGILGQRGRAIPQEMLHQMLDHPVPEVCAEAILTLSSLNDISLAEALVAVNDSRLEPVIASCRAFLGLARVRRDIPADLLIEPLVKLQNRKYSCNGYVAREAITHFIHTLDELHATIPPDILLDALTRWGELVEPLVIRYWQRHAPAIFAEMMVQAKAFLQQHL